MKVPPCSVSYRKVGREIKYLPGKSLNKIAYTKQLRVNRTRKQRDIFQKKDFIVFIKEFAAFSFSKKDVAYKLYVSILFSNFRIVGFHDSKRYGEKCNAIK